jgi:hypothetical protein
LGSEVEDLAGADYVLFGQLGTGKSQSITHCLAHGKTVQRDFPSGKSGE